jgi:hypothetical protein
VSADDNNFDPDMFDSLDSPLSFDEMSESLDSSIQRSPRVDPLLERLLNFDHTLVQHMLDEYSSPEEIEDLSDMVALQDMARNHKPLRKTRTTPHPPVNVEDAHTWLNALPYGEIILTREGRVVFIYASGSFEQMRTWRESTQLAFFTSVVPEAMFLGISNDFNAFIKSQAMVHVFEHTYLSSQGAEHLQAMFEYRPKTSYVHLTLIRERSA